MAFKEAIKSGVEAQTQAIGTMTSPITRGAQLGLGVAAMKLNSIFGKSKLAESPAGIEVAKIANEKIDISQARIAEKEFTQTTAPYIERAQAPSQNNITKSGIHGKRTLLKYDTVYNIIAQSKFADYGGKEE